MNAAAPVDRGADFFGGDMSKLSRPIAAEAGADGGDLAGVDFRTFEQIVERGCVDLVRIGSGWRERMIGWGNVSVAGGRLHAAFGFVSARSPRDRAFSQGLEAELAAMQRFLGLGAAPPV